MHYHLGRVDHEEIQEHKWFSSCHSGVDGRTANSWSVQENAVIGIIQMGDVYTSEMPSQHSVTQEERFDCSWGWNTLSLNLRCLLEKVPVYERNLMACLKVSLH